MHRRPCVNRKEENYFFALSKYQAQLEELCSNPGGFGGCLVLVLLGYNEGLCNGVRKVMVGLMGLAASLCVSA